MENILATLATAAITFAATNIDDIFILMLFFSQTDKGFHFWHIVAGQVAGFTALVLISLLGFFGGLVIPRAWVGLMGLVPIILGVRHWLNRTHEDELEESEKEQVSKSRKGSALAAMTSVAAITFSNGGDNLGIYTPLFASLNSARLLLTLAVFYALLAVWCLIGFVITRHKTFAHVITYYGHLIVPFILVALGFYIIIQNGTLALFGVGMR
jgi:cadmium resistance transport/sequestration family protein